MIYLQLFYEFLKIGLFSFGGAYGAIPLIKESVLNQGWMSVEMFTNLIAISESSPGPIMINAATYIGYTQGGIMGAIAATVGVVLPSFIIVLMLSMLLKKWIKSRNVQCVLRGIKPCLMGIILATGIYMLGQILVGEQSLDYMAAIITFSLVTILVIFKKIKGKELSPIVLIGVSAILGIVLY
jgi:chromate transporter